LLQAEIAHRLTLTGPGRSKTRHATTGDLQAILSKAPPSLTISHTSARSTRSQAQPSERIVLDSIPIPPVTVQQRKYLLPPDPILQVKKPAIPDSKTPPKKPAIRRKVWRCNGPLELSSKLDELETNHSWDLRYELAARRLVSGRLGQDEWGVPYFCLRADGK
jgi:hypothetical protein